MTAFTGAGGAGPSIPDPLKGKIPHAVVCQCSRRRWAAWCACRPGRISKWHPTPEKAVEAVVQGHSPGEGVGTFPLTVEKQWDLYGWKVTCGCSWETTCKTDTGAEEAGVVHWANTHMQPAAKSKLVSVHAPAASGPKKKAAAADAKKKMTATSKGISTHSGTGPAKPDTWFHATVKSGPDGWYLENDTQRLDIRVELPEPVWELLKGRSVEFETVAGDGRGHKAAVLHLNRRSKLARQIAEMTGY